MMRALITGGAGFVGSHLAETLLNERATVTVIDDLSTGRMNNITHLKKHVGFNYVIDTVMNRPLMAELVSLIARASALVIFLPLIVPEVSRSNIFLNGLIIS